MSVGDPAYPLFPFFGFLSCFLVLIPLPWHFQAWNAGTCLYMLWTALGCFNAALNSVIWHNDAIDYAPIWCDISTRFQAGLGVAIPAASLCINRRLYKIATSNSVGSSKSDKRNAVFVDLAIGLGIPILEMIFVYVVQGHRYNIFEGVGCQLAIFNTPPAYPLFFTWPIIIGLVSAVYCVLTLRAFMRRRAEFSHFLSTQPSSLNIGRYFRLMALATTELFFNVPINSYGLYLNISSGNIQPWKGWDDAHFDWWTIAQFPAILWRQNTASIVALEMGRWLIVLCAILFFVFFGFAEEARKNYRMIFWAVLSLFGKYPPAPSSKFSPSPASSGKGVWKDLPCTPKKKAWDWGWTDDVLPSFVTRASTTFSSSTTVVPSSPSPAYTASEYTSPFKSKVVDLSPRSPLTPPKHDFPTPTSMKTSFDVDVERSHPHDEEKDLHLSHSPPPLPRANGRVEEGQWLYHFDQSSPTHTGFSEFPQQIRSITIARPTHPPRVEAPSYLSPAPRRSTRTSLRPLSSPF